MSDPNQDKTEPQPPKTVEGLGARASEIYQDAKPKVDELVTRTKPRVEEASKQAARYVREHEDDIKRAATSVARYRFLPAPLRLMFEALRPEPSGSEALTCASCQHTNPPSAKFCNQCGERLMPPSSLQH